MEPLTMGTKGKVASYEEAVALIAALEPRGWRLGLDRMQELCVRAGLLGALGGASAPKFVHVAGTNGKGSTTAFAMHLMHAGGYATGAFFSPYVVDYRERIQADCQLIPEADLIALTNWLFPIAESLSDSEFGGVTKFEFETALAFEFWRRRGSEWVALEVGLGGRLDATNVVTPACSVIVSIGLDHVSILGDTVARIAAEKAGVIKPNRPVVVGRLTDEALGPVLAAATAQESPVWLFGRDITLEQQGDMFSVRTPMGEHTDLKPGLDGVCQPHNMALAIAACELAGLNLSRSQVQDGVAQTWIPGRFERRTVGRHRLVLDGAHNADAAEALAGSLRAIYPGQRIWMVAGMLHGHEPQAFFKPLLPLVERLYLVPLSYSRSRAPEDIAATIAGNDTVVTICESVSDAMSTLISGSPPESLLVVTGSNYLVGEVTELLQELRWH